MKSRTLNVWWLANFKRCDSRLSRKLLFILSMQSIAEIRRVLTTSNMTFHSTRFSSLINTAARCWQGYSACQDQCFSTAQISWTDQSPSWSAVFHQPLKNTFFYLISHNLKKQTCKWLVSDECGRGLNFQCTILTFAMNTHAVHEQRRSTRFLTNTQKIPKWQINEGQYKFARRLVLKSRSCSL